MKKIFLVTLLILIVCMKWGLCAQENRHGSSSNEIDTEILQKAKETMGKGLKWLASMQREDGSWSNTNFPALTALAVMPFVKSDYPERDKICEKAIKFIVGFVQKDGGIYKPASGGRGSGGLSVYNTAVCMMVLNAVDKQKYAEMILNARSFMKNSQLVGDSPAAGGFGYENDATSRRADLSNTAWVLRAMAETRSVEDLRKGSERVDIDWKAAIEYVRKLQNQNKDDMDNFGSFGYDMSGERGGIMAGKDKKVRLAGYGSMTYAGLEAMIFADVDRKDPQVRSAIEWAGKHWSVEENPGMGQKGLFYYYNIISKTLSLLGSEALKDTSGRIIPWKHDLIDQLIKTQRTDGSWINTDNQFWEGDPVLVTAYSLISMQYTLGE